MSLVVAVIANSRNSLNFKHTYTPLKWKSFPCNKGGRLWDEKWKWDKRKINSKCNKTFLLQVVTYSYSLQVYRIRINESPVSYHGRTSPIHLLQIIDISYPWWMERIRLGNMILWLRMSCPVGRPAVWLSMQSNISSNY